MILILKLTLYFKNNRLLIEANLLIIKLLNSMIKLLPLQSKNVIIVKLFLFFINWKTTFMYISLLFYQNQDN